MSRETRDEFDRCAVVIGPSDRSLLWRVGTVSEGDYDGFVQEYARVLASVFDNVIVTPDDGVYTDIALEVSKLKGVPPIAYYPDRDVFYGTAHIEPNYPQYDTRPIGGDWYTLNADLTKKARTVVCLGYTPGSLIELCFMKYHQKYGAFKDKRLADLRLIVDLRAAGSRLPTGVEEQIKNVQYVSDWPALKKALDQ